MAANARVTRGAWISTIAVTTVATSPIAACRNDTARRFSPNAHASASNANTPNADCNFSIDPPEPTGADYRLHAPMCNAACGFSQTICIVPQAIDIGTAVSHGVRSGPSVGASGSLPPRQGAGN